MRVGVVGGRHLEGQGARLVIAETAARAGQLVQGGSRPLHRRCRCIQAPKLRSADFSLSRCRGSAGSPDRLRPAPTAACSAAPAWSPCPRGRACRGRRGWCGACLQDQTQAVECAPQPLFHRQNRGMGDASAGLIQKTCAVMQTHGHSQLCTLHLQSRPSQSSPHPAAPARARAPAPRGRARCWPGGVPGRRAPPLTWPTHQTPRSAGSGAQSRPAWRGGPVHVQVGKRQRDHEGVDRGVVCMP